jgi:hypothetical protein
MTLRGVVKRLLQVVFLIAGGILLGIVLLKYSDAGWAIYLRWLALVFYTLIVFGAAVSEFRPSWKRIAFWLCVCALFLVHIAAYILVLRAVAEWRNIWFLPLSIAECPVLVLVLHLLGYGERSAPPRHRPLGTDEHGAHR